MGGCESPAEGNILVVMVVLESDVKPFFCDYIIFSSVNFRGHFGPSLSYKSKLSSHRISAVNISIWFECILYHREFTTDVADEDRRHRRDRTN